MASTDDDLRRELEKHGVIVGPITATTRSIYAKRLEKLANKQQKTATKTPAKPLASKSSKQQVLTRNRSESPALRSGRSTRVSRKKAVGYSTDEDDNENDTVVKKPVSSKSEMFVNMHSTRQNTRRNNVVASSEPEVPRSLTPVHRRVKALANTRKSSSVSPKRDVTSSPLTRPGERYSDDSDDASERSTATNDSWVQMESAGTNTSPSLARNRCGDKEERLQRFRAEIEAWRESEEKENAGGALSSRHLSSGRRSAVLRNVDQNARSGGAARNGGLNAASEIVTRASSRTDDPQSSMTDPAGGEPGQKRPWTLNFSSFLPVGTCIFFAILGLLYATMKYDPSLNSDRMINDSSEEDSGLEFLRFVHLIYDHAAVHEGEKECGIIASDHRLTVSELSKDLGIMDNAGQGFSKACEKLIQNDWGVQFYGRDDEVITDPKNQQLAVYVKSTAPVLGGWCRFTRAVQKVFLRIIFTTAAGIIVWLGLVYRRYRSERQREEREQMYTTVQKILDVLRRQYDLSENKENTQPFLPILHVRDMIIPPQDRKKMEKVWERAKQFLSASETRIRVENQTIQGEDYLVWRWIQASSPATRHTPTSRVWQGEAFDITRGPMICPTPCLKLRNVFDPAMEISKNWIEQIQDSILEKCQGNNEILRICVEKDSKEGLVYMLCASNQSAGRAFQALHGAWFDGRLVTVKFIRLHRFHQRFPDSVNQSRTAMRPTSAVPVSTINAPSPTVGTDSQHFEKLYPTLPDD